MPYLAVKLLFKYAAEMLDFILIDFLHLAVKSAFKYAAERLGLCPILHTT